jgi:hypothetical protein
MLEREEESAGAGTGAGRFGDWKLVDGVVK